MWLTIKLMLLKCRGLFSNISTSKWHKSQAPFYTLLKLFMRTCVSFGFLQRSKDELYLFILNLMYLEGISNWSISWIMESMYLVISGGSSPMESRMFFTSMWDGLLFRMTAAAAVRTVFSWILRLWWYILFIVSFTWSGNRLFSQCSHGWLGKVQIGILFIISA